MGVSEPFQTKSGSVFRLTPDPHRVHRYFRKPGAELLKTPVRGAVLGVSKLETLVSMFDVTKAESRNTSEIYRISNRYPRHKEASTSEYSK